MCVGGRYHIPTIGPGESVPAHGTYTEVVPGKRLAFTDVFDLIPGEEPYDTFRTNEPQAVPGGTKMTLTCVGIRNAKWRQLTKGG